MESAEAFAQKMELDFATDNLDALLARDNIDVIDICTPPCGNRSRGGLC